MRAALKRVAKGAGPAAAEALVQPLLELPQTGSLPLAHLYDQVIAAWLHRGDATGLLPFVRKLFATGAKVSSQSLRLCVHGARASLDLEAESIRTRRLGTARAVELAGGVMPWHVPASRSERRQFMAALSKADWRDLDHLRQALRFLPGPVRTTVQRHWSDRLRDEPRLAKPVLVGPGALGSISGSAPAAALPPALRMRQADLVAAGAAVDPSAADADLALPSIEPPPIPAAGPPRRLFAAQKLLMVPTQWVALLGPLLRITVKPTPPTAPAGEAGVESWLSDELYGVAKTVEAFAQAAAMAGEFDDAFTWVDRLSEWELPVSGDTMGTLVEALCLADQPNRAMASYEIAVAEGLTVPARAVLALVKSLSAAGRLEEAERVATEALLLLELPASEALFLELMDGAGRAGSTAACLRTLRAAQAQGHLLGVDDGLDSPGVADGEEGVLDLRGIPQSALPILLFAALRGLQAKAAAGGDQRTAMPGSLRILCTHASQVAVLSALQQLQPQLRGTAPSLALPGERQILDPQLAVVVSAEDLSAWLTTPRPGPSTAEAIAGGLTRDEVLQRTKDAAWGGARWDTALASLARRREREGQVDEATAAPGWDAHEAPAAGAGGSEGSTGMVAEGGAQLVAPRRALDPPARAPVAGASAAEFALVEPDGGGVLTPSVAEQRRERKRQLAFKGGLGLPSAFTGVADMGLNTPEEEQIEAEFAQWHEQWALRRQQGDRKLRRARTTALQEARQERKEEERQARVEKVLTQQRIDMGDGPVAQLGPGVGEDVRRALGGSGPRLGGPASVDLAGDEGTAGGQQRLAAEAGLDALLKLAEAQRLAGADELPSERLAEADERPSDHLAVDSDSDSSSSDGADEGFFAAVAGGEDDDDSELWVEVDDDDEDEEAADQLEAAAGIDLATHIPGEVQARGAAGRNAPFGSASEHPRLRQMAADHVAARPASEAQRQRVRDEWDRSAAELEDQEQASTLNETGETALEEMLRLAELGDWDSVRARAETQELEARLVAMEAGHDLARPATQSHVLALGGVGPMAATMGLTAEDMAGAVSLDDPELDREVAEQEREAEERIRTLVRRNKGERSGLMDLTPGGEVGVEVSDIRFSDDFRGLEEFGIGKPKPKPRQQRQVAATGKGSRKAGKPGQAGKRPARRQRKEDR